MRLAIMQPYLFPYLGYFQLIHAVDTFVILDNVNYIKKGYINRNKILINNEAHAFTLELCKASQTKKINEIKIGNNQQTLLKTIERAYKKAPAFNAVFPVLTEILLHQEQNLAQFVGHSLKKLAAYLELTPEFIYASTLKQTSELKGQDKILDICQQLKNKIYINAIGGQSLYKKEDFTSHHIKLNFIQSEISPYPQYTHEFISHLSIIDVLMFNPKAKVINMLSQYTLI